MRFIWSPATILTLSTIITRTVIAISRTNWIFLWASIELNLLRFIPILMSSKSNQETEGSIKYFLAQAIGSALLLTSSLILWSPYSPLPEFIPRILIISVLLKLGSAPCHFWYPSVISSISWISCTILSSWQKLAPLTILIFFVANTLNSLIILIAGLNALLGGIIGINQSQLRTIIAYSSIGHLGWIIRFILLDRPIISILYFTIYCSLIIPLFITLNLINLITLKQLRKITIISPTSQLIISIILISVAGLPPLTGFIPKILAIIILSRYNTPIIIILIMGSLINLYFYLNIIIGIIAPNQNTNIYTKKSINIPNYLLILSGITSIGIAPIIIIYAMIIFYKPQRYWNTILHFRYLSRYNWSRNKTPYSNRIKSAGILSRVGSTI